MDECSGNRLGPRALTAQKTPASRRTGRGRRTREAHAEDSFTTRCGAKKIPLVLAADLGIQIAKAVVSGFTMTTSILRIGHG